MKLNHALSLLFMFMSGLLTGAAVIGSITSPNVSAVWLWIFAVVGFANSLRNYFVDDFKPEELK